MAAIQLYSKGANVWIKDPDRVWQPARVTKDFDGGKVLHIETEELETKEVALKSDADLPPLRNPDILIGSNDLTELSYLHEPAVLHNLEVRFLQNQSIYTYCGIVLVAINPYEELHIYGNDTIAMYRGKSMGDLDPHIYAVAEEAFTKMERDNSNQSIIVSGESGAGKTVSAKYAMRYFATVGGMSQTETQVEKRVLASNPIMEAIGNAKTTRNDNSSRFGKYIEIDFNKQFHIIGANMRTYLLEKSRVVFQAPDERNYHIFYQMCASRDEPDMAEMQLQHPDHFSYLYQGECPDIDGVDDRKEFSDTREAFRLLGFADRDQKNIFKILAGILHLGNIEIEPGSGKGDSESSLIAADDASLKAMCELLEIEVEQIRKWLVSRKIVTARETYTKPMNAESAIFAKDALAKFIYSNLFDWIVVQINKALRTTGKINKFIGVLDIYGFETFEINSFEQFCINYANEKLQQQFNMHVFKLEQSEYLKEGIEWTMIDFYDNQPCIDLIESKLGVLDLLDEECRMPKGSDKSWVEKLYDKCKKWDHFQKPRLSQTAFIVRHFADHVEYECSGFLDKNRDTVMEEQLNILKGSNNDLVSELFLEKATGGSGPSPAPRAGKTPAPRAGGGAKQHKKTVGSQFRDSLNLLMSTLNSTTPHYVRCIKPNDAKAAFQFDPGRGVQQLRACGVLETVRISAAGYPSRWTYYDFFVRYRVLCHSKDVKKNDFRTTAENIVAKLISDPDKYQFGKTKLFFRAGQVALMEKLRSEKLRDCCIMIQKHVKGWLSAKRYVTIRKATMTIQRWSRGFVARRKARFLRRTKAVITLQRTVRMWVKRTQYLRLREKTIMFQAHARGQLARLRHRELVRNAKAVVIQKHVRGWLQRKSYQKKMKQIVMVQCQVRRWRAKRMLKKFKIEAKSVEHQKKLNQGLENKIISLQQRLTESERERKDLKNKQNEFNTLLQEVEVLKKTDAESKNKLQMIEDLQTELERLKVELDREKGEKVDLVNEKQKEKDLFAEKETEYTKEINELRQELVKVKEDATTKGAVDTEEMLQRIEDEKSNLHTEYEQERIAYQKLLKDYNRLEQQHENLMDEVHQLRGGSVDRSMLSLYPGDEESAYGSVSGSGSVRSTGAPERPRVDQIDWEQSGDNDMAATMMKLQQKVKQLEKEKDKYERRIEELEATHSPSNEKQTAEHIRLQELEMENSKLQGDLQKLRESIVMDEATGENSQIKELMDQFEELRDELDRRREECIQLRTVLANVSIDQQPLSLLSRSSELPEAEELYTAYETQKNVIAQLQEQLSEERSKSKEIATELKKEIEKLERENASHQQLINQTLSKGPSNQAELYLQHEITRLTSENIDLREKIENLNETIKRQKRQIKAFMKKLTDAGATLPDVSFDAIPENESTAAPDRSLPVIHKKAHDYLGMFEYKGEDEQQILKAMIYNLKPKTALSMLTGLPGYFLFMMIRYTDYINNDVMVRSLIQGAITLIKKVVKRRGQNDLEVKTLWLSNILRILHNLKQYSGEKAFQTGSSPKQIEQCLRNFDLSEYRRVFSDIAIWIYQGVTKLIEEEIQPLLVPAVLEHEGIGTISAGEHIPRQRYSSGTANDLDSPTHIDPREALDKLLKLLTRFHTILTKHGLDPEIISQTFKQIFYFICAGSLNNLLLRKDMCHWSRGMQIRYNVAQLEQWARDQRVHDERTQTIESLAPIVQASQLLQARKSDEDVQAVCDMCDKLKVVQIIKILNLYTPADEFEERVTPSFVRKVQAKLQERAMKESEEQATLLMDTKYNFAVRFPFNPSSIQLEELEIPDHYNNLHTMLKKI